jgi:hypothetical protein
MIVPAVIWTSNNSATTMKYLPMRFWLGVSGRNSASSGSVGASSGLFRKNS